MRLNPCNFFPLNLAVMLELLFFISNLGYFIFWVLKYHNESDENVKKVTEMHVLYRYYRTEKPRQCFIVVVGFFFVFLV